MVDTYTLNNGIEIPKIAFGTWQLEEGDVAYKSVAKALELGYHHIDTAQVYGNENSVGQAIQDSGIDRQDIFLTTKVWNDKGSYEATKLSIDESMEKLKVDYLDLLLIHWPNPKEFQANDGWKERNAQVWKAMEEYYQAGKVKAIGVSNFLEHHLEELLKTATVKPQVNQIKLSPGLSQDELVAYCRQHDILLEAYSPLGKGEIFSDNDLKTLAEKYNRTVAQLALQWSLQHGFLPLPRSQNPVNIESNLQVGDFELAAEDMEAMDQIEGLVEAPDPDHASF